MMVSAVVRATPRLTFHTLTTIAKHGRNVGNVFADGQLLQAGQDSRDVLLLHFTPGGALGSVASPRDLVVARTWRLDDDGTYVLLYQSTDHPAAPPLQWGPVRGRVLAAGITISPLAARFCPPGGPPSASPECLVTLVLNVDPGGWLSPASWLGRCLPGWARLAWAEPFVLSVIALRDRVEQSRFVVQPFSLVEWTPSESIKDDGHPPLPVTQPSFLVPRCDLWVVVGRFTPITRLLYCCVVCAAPHAWGGSSLAQQHALCIVYMAAAHCMYHRSCPHPQRASHFPHCTY